MKLRKATKRLLRVEKSDRELSKINCNRTPMIGVVVDYREEPQLAFTGNRINPAVTAIAFPQISVQCGL